MLRTRTENLLVEEESIKALWKEYTEKLYDKQGKPLEVMIEEEKEVDESTWGLISWKVK